MFTGFSVAVGVAVGSVPGVCVAAGSGVCTGSGVFSGSPVAEGLSVGSSVFSGVCVGSGVLTGSSVAIGLSVGGTVGLSVGFGSGVAGGISSPFEVTFPAFSQQDVSDKLMCKTGQTALSVSVIILPAENKYPLQSPCMF